jgi:hypothetical protein
MPLYRSRVLIPVLALFLTTFFFWSIDRYDRSTLDKFTNPLHQFTPSSKTQVQLPPQTPLDHFCNTDGSVLPYPPLQYAEWLSHKNFTRVYMRPNIVPTTTQFKNLEVIDRKVLSEPRSLAQGLAMEDGSKPTDCPAMIDVDIARDEDNEDTGAMLFGMATTVERLRKQLPALLFSYAHTKATLVVLVPGDTQDVPGHERYFRKRGLDIILKPSPLEFTARYFGLVEAFTEVIQTRPQTGWVSFVDDDTFFLALGRVAKKLKAMDSNKKWFVGALSELHRQVDIFGHIAFGGAGVFVSRPLLAILHAVYQQCQDTGEQPGDQKLAQCIEKYGDTELTLWDTLFQMDMKGKVDGVFESGRTFDTLHHWSSWYTKDVVKMSAVAATAGRNSILRRWKFDEQIEHVDGHDFRVFWVLTNGYSLVKYAFDASLPEDYVNFDQTEGTWDDDLSSYEPRLGPLRPINQANVYKERWLLLDSMVVGRNVHQIYSHEFQDSHSLVELVWVPPDFTGKEAGEETGKETGKEQPRPTPLPMSPPSPTATAQPTDSKR